MPPSHPKHEGETAGRNATPAGGAAWWLEVIKVAAMPLVTLVVGFAINSSLDSRQARENNLRLYTDMMGRREDADSALRKDMFKSILDTFMQKDPKPQERELEQQVLDIELLAYNFHESLDIGPLFKHVRRQIPDDETGPNADRRARLEKVAQEVNERQLTGLSDSGTVVRGSTELEKVRTVTAYPAFSGTYAVMDKGLPGLCLQLNQGAKPQYRRFRLEVIDFDPKSREVQARLYVSHQLAMADCRRADLELVGNREIDTTFWVGLFAFPMIDNTRLSYGERCAVSVTELTPDSVELALAYFPASRASLKDKPFYDELMHDLLGSEPPSARRAP